MRGFYDYDDKVGRRAVKTALATTSASPKEESFFGF